jgi:hypothetical protein
LAVGEKSDGANEERGDDCARIAERGAYGTTKQAAEKVQKAIPQGLKPISKHGL